MLVPLRCGMLLWEAVSRAAALGLSAVEVIEGVLCFSPLSLSHQPKVVVTLNVTSPDLFRLVFRYVSRGPASVEGRVSVVEEGRFNVCGNCKCIFHF